MNDTYKSVEESKVSLSELMLPSHTNFSGKIHGGYLLRMLDQIAFACASKHSGTYCVTASVDTVDFLQPVEVGELVTMKASVNYVGRSSMVIGIRVEAEHIQTGKIKHCNSSYFTMVAKDDLGNNISVPGLILKNEDELRRFFKSVKRIEQRKQRQVYDSEIKFSAKDYLHEVEGHHVKIEL